MGRAIHVALLVVLALAAAARPARAQAPGRDGAGQRAVARVNQAVVRVLALTGADATWMPSHEDPTVTGPDANVNMEYGTGTAIRPDLVLTAKHVVWGSEAIFVVPDGTTDAVAAHVVFSDPVADLAFLAVDGRLPHAIALPAHAPAPSSGADLWVSGFPIDPRESHAAVARSNLSRVMDDGRLQLSAEVNPGNSGGPVFDGRGALLGVVVERGDPAAGVQGVATAEPASVAAAAYAHDVAHAPAPSFDAFERALAAALSRTLSRTPVNDTALLEAVVTATTDTATPGERMLGALCAWGVVRHRLFAARTNDMAGLPPDVRTATEPFRARAVDLARGALSDAPYLRASFSFGVMLVRTHGDPAELARRVPHP